MVGFDEYDRKARLTPGLLACLPVVFLVITLGLKAYPAIAIGAGIVGGAGAAYLLAIVVRHMGRVIEAGLWESWGGPPTTRRLRSRTNEGNSVERAIWRDAIQSATGVVLSTPDEEMADPVHADERIEASVRQMTRLGQDDRFPLVKAENIQYGFERNLYAIRWIARGIALACIVALVLVAVVGPISIGGTRVSTGAIVVGIVIDSLIFAGWLLIPSAKRAKLAADRYADQLLRAIVVESKASSGST